MTVLMFLDVDDDDSVYDDEEDAGEDVLFERSKSFMFHL